MIGKVNTGQYFKGALDYNSKGEIIDKNVMADQVKEQVQEMKMVANQNHRASNKVKHFILSFAQNDKMDDNHLVDISRDYLDRMGYSNNQYITYKHTDTKHLHLHIVTNRIDMEGQAVKDGKEKHKSRSIIKALEKKYNLTRTKRRSQETKKNTHAYKAAEKRLNAQGKKTDKQIIREQVSKALAKKPRSEQELQKYLGSVTLIQNKSGNGYNFEYNGMKYKASDINRSYSYARLNAQFEQNNKSLEQPSIKNGQDSSVTSGSIQGGGSNKNNTDEEEEEKKKRRKKKGRNGGMSMN